MKCRTCQSENLKELWVDRDGYQWLRCADCRSDTSEAPYDPERYLDDSYVRGMRFTEGSDALANHEHNAKLFDKHAPGKPGRTFLDVGCGHGASIEVMRSRGWACVGWDVSNVGRPEGTVHSSSFGSEIFARPFDAVLCRAVIEHVPEPLSFLKELVKATGKGGILQITTPRPLEENVRWAYHWAHLSLWHPDKLAQQLKKLDVEILETQLWDLGQRHVAKRV